MSLDMTVSTRSAGTATPVEDAAAPASRLWVYELVVAVAAAFGAVLASGLSVLLYLR